MILRAKLAPIYVLFLAPIFSIQAQNNSQYRTVKDTELGSVFQAPNNFPWSAFGVYIGVGSGDTQFVEDTLKGRYSHFNHFGPGVDVQLGFPYSALRKYESQEVAGGRNPMFVTATYEGKKRPVLFVTYLALDKNNKPTTKSSNWVYAVNTQDDRFINFWINHYARPAVLQPLHSMSNVWMYMDGAAFSYSAYGVLDDNGVYHGGVQWDPPFAQNADDYLDSIAYFFNKVKKLAPDIRFMTDVGTMSDPTKFQSIYANIPGALAEDTLAWYTNPTAYMLNNFYTQIIPWFSWLGSTGRVAVMGAQLPNNFTTVDLLTGYALYALLKGPNFFFATRDQKVNPMAWEGWNAALGTPVASYQQSEAHGAPANRLFSRQYSSGYVYLNWTGSTQTVTLPSGKWVDPYGNPVTKLTIPNLTGSLVTAAPYYATTSQPPEISPRCAGNMEGPVTVTITSPTAHTVVHYTLDGSTPTSKSPAYTGPFQLNSNTVVTARAFGGSNNPSTLSVASYKIVSGAPTVEFMSSSETGAASGAASVSTYYPVLSLSAVPQESVTVKYAVIAPSGKSTTGSVTFPAGEMYTQFPVSVSGSGTWKVAIASVTGATAGSTQGFEYTAQ